MTRFLLLLLCAATLPACNSDDDRPTNTTETEARTYVGTLAVTPLAGGETNTFEEVRFIFEVAEDGTTATIHMIETRFVPEMPRLDMDIPGIPVEPTAIGYSFAADAIVPTCAGVPYKQYVITGLSGLDTAAQLDAAFDCMGFRVVYSGTL